MSLVTDTTRGPNFQVTFMKNPEQLDDKLYCLCQQKWDGKLMIECELCDNWYHPDCIGIHEKDDIKLNLMYIVCSLCKAQADRRNAKINQQNKNIDNFLENLTSMAVLDETTSVKKLPSNSTSELIKKQKKRVDSMFENYYKGENNNKRFKDLMQLVRKSPKGILGKRDFEGNCAKMQMCKLKECQMKRVKTDE